jgi:type III secretion system FlhB-like substrate exporter
MGKSEIVDQMVEIAEDFNLLAIEGAGLPEEQVKQMIDQVRPQLYAVQGEIYDFLLAQGIIKED